MRFTLLAAVAALVLIPAAGTTADDNEPKIPDLKAKEWKKLGDAGLEIWDAKEGKGDEVKAGAKLKVHYTGWLTTGEIFDSSVVRKEPIEFPLDGLIKGWQQGLPGMKVGGVRRLKIPPELAYGKKEKGKIPANSTLVFEVELLEMENKPMVPDLNAKEWKKLGNAGLEIWDVKEGEGDAVKAGGKVTVHYTGWLTDGKQFDSQRRRRADHIRPWPGHQGLAGRHSGDEAGRHPPARRFLRTWDTAKPVRAAISRPTPCLFSKCNSSSNPKAKCGSVDRTSPPSLLNFSPRAAAAARALGFTEQHALAVELPHRRTQRNRDAGDQRNRHGRQMLPRERVRTQPPSAAAAARVRLPPAPSS